MLRLKILFLIFSLNHFHMSFGQDMSKLFEYFGSLGMPIPPDITKAKNIVEIMFMLDNEWVKKDIQMEIERSKNLPERETFDYVIVGGGTAGSVISRRLSESGKNSVLLLEAGGTPNPLTKIPVFGIFLLLSPFSDWGYKTSSQKHACKSMKNNQCTIWRPKNLGGCTTKIIMYYNRGSKNDYKRWAKLTKDSRWDWENVLRVFMKSENYQGNWPNASIHGLGGHLNINKAGFQPSIQNYIDAGLELGFPNKDYNDGNYFGVSAIDHIDRKGTREHSWQAFYENLPKLDNLQIRRYAHASKINFDKKMKTTSVTYIHNGVKKRVFANKEIIISGGAIGSPQLLMLSGIGIKKDLEKLKIKTLKNLPVGKNLHDHTCLYVGPFPKSPAFDSMKDLNGEAFAQYAINGTGPFSFYSAVGGLFFKSSKDALWEDFHMFEYPLHLTKDIDPLLSEFYNYKNGIFKSFMGPNTDTDAMLPIVCHVLPKSRGQLTLRSANFSDPPIINPNYLAESYDVEAMLKGINMTLRFYEETRAFNSKLTTSPIAPCKNHEFRSREYWICVIRNQVIPYFHHGGTCRMGHGKKDRLAVVTSDLKVIGTKGLRVCDASIMPILPSSNTIAPSIMIGEMCSESILKDSEDDKLLSFMDK